MFLCFVAWSVSIHGSLAKGKSSVFCSFTRELDLRRGRPTTKSKPLVVVPLSHEEGLVVCETWKNLPHTPCQVHKGLLEVPF